MEFVVQYETKISNEWKPIVHYDTAYGFAHKDMISAKVKIIKQPLYFDSYNLAFTYATIDLKSNWTKYRRNYLGEENDDAT